MYLKSFLNQAFSNKPNEDYCELFFMATHGLLSWKRHFFGALIAIICHHTSVLSEYQTCYLTTEEFLNMSQCNNYSRKYGVRILESVIGY